MKKSPSWEANSHSLGLSSEESATAPYPETYMRGVTMKFPERFHCKAHLYSYSLLRGVTFEVLLLSRYVPSPTILPLLETFLELLLWNSF
jgi:hypothetical protein